MSTTAIGPGSYEVQTRIQCCARTSLAGLTVISFVAGTVLIVMAATGTFGPTGSTYYGLAMGGGCVLSYLSLNCLLNCALTSCKKTSRISSRSTLYSRQPSRRDIYYPTYTVPPKKEDPPPPPWPKITTFHEFSELPLELQAQVLYFAPFENLGKGRIALSKNYYAAAQEAIKQKAHYFGFKGDDFKQARTYLEFLFNEIKNADSANFLPARPLPGTSLDQRAINLNQLSVDQIYYFYNQLDSNILHAYPYLTTYLLHLVESKAITGTVKPKTFAFEAMIYACYGGKSDLVKLLLLIGVDPNLKSNIGSDQLNQHRSAALHYAAQMWHHQIVNLLLQHGSQVDAKGLEGHTALCFALDCVKRGKKRETTEEDLEKTLQLLLKSGADIGLSSERPSASSAIRLAAKRPGVSSFLLLLDSIDKEKEKDALNQLDENGHTLLYSLIEETKEEEFILEKILILLQRGADPNIACGNGAQKQVALHLAAGKGFNQVVVALIDHKADPNALNSSGSTLLYELIKSTNNEDEILERVVFLLENGADPTLKIKEGDTPLHVAIFGGFSAPAESMIEKATALDTRNSRGETPLFFAVRLTLLGLNRFSLIEKLLQKKADPNIPTNLGQRVLNDAIKLARDTKLISLLLSHSADPNAQDEEGLTPLSCILRNESLPPEEIEKVVELLIEKGAKPEALNQGGNPPLIDALEKGQQKIAETLLQHMSDLNTALPKGETLLIKVMKSKAIDEDRKLEAVKLLVEKGASPFCQSDKGRTVFHYAAVQDSTRILEYLLEKDPDLIYYDAPDKQGLTPLCLAVQKGKKEIIGLLHQKGAKADHLVTMALNKDNWFLKNTSF